MKRLNYFHFTAFALIIYLELFYIFSHILFINIIFYYTEIQDQNQLLSAAMGTNKTLWL